MSWPCCLNLDSEHSFLGNPLCTELCVFIACHLEKLQCILHLENLEMDFNQEKLVHCCLQKMKRSVQYSIALVGCLWLFSLIKDTGVQMLGKFQSIHGIATCCSSGLTQELPSCGTCVPLPWNLSWCTCVGPRNYIIRKLFFSYFFLKSYFSQENDSAAHVLLTPLLITNLVRN